MIRVLFPPNPDAFFVTAMAKRFHRGVSGRGLSLAGCVFLGLLMAGSPTAASDNVTGIDAAGPAGSIHLDSELTAEAQRELAERFSPVLVFHPSERYFPTSPLFPLERQLSDADTGASIASRLGTTDERRAYYEGLTVPQKAGLSTVYYRAYHARAGGEPVVVVEYWLYYVYNAYRVRGNILPFWIDGSHPNDLEHIHVV